MEWARERDLLIAQTLAFVQSVSDEALARRPDAREPVAESYAAPQLEAAPVEMVISSIEPPATPRFDIEPLQPDLSGDIRTEILTRVANFRAHQQRFRREREEYCRATMAKVRISIRDDSEPPPRRK
jgi:hypothetical protein